MIKIEHPYNSREDLIRTSSDNGMMIKQVETGILYSEAVDIYPSQFNYEETDIFIEEI